MVFADQSQKRELNFDYAKGNAVTLAPIAFNCIKLGEIKGKTFNPSIAVCVLEYSRI